MPPVMLLDPVTVTLRVLCGRLCVGLWLSSRMLRVEANQLENTEHPSSLTRRQLRHFERLGGAQPLDDMLVPAPKAPPAPARTRREALSLERSAVRLSGAVPEEVSPGSAVISSEDVKSAPSSKSKPARDVPVDHGAASSSVPRQVSPPARMRRGRAVVAMTLAALLVVGTSLATTIPRPSVVAAPLEAIQSSQAMAASPSVTGPSATRDGYTVTEAKKQAVAAGISVADTYINNPSSSVQWPFPVGVPISDYFGPRSSPGGIGSTDHKGVDFTPGEGAPISAVADGVVRLVQATDQGGLGVHVVIDHVIDGQNVSSWYGHMLTGSPTVEEGQVVVAGQQIGSVGNTGVSTGAHTHLEIHVGSTPVDPYAFISSRN